MNRFIIRVACLMVPLLLMVLGSTCFGEYVIKLKNGRVLPTARYWEEQGQVKFYWGSGVASVPKTNVLAIVDVKKEPQEWVPPVQESAPAVEETTPMKEIASVKGTNPPKEVGERKVQGTTPVAPQGKLDILSYKKQKAVYTDQYEKAYQRYLEASARKDPEAKKKAWKEFNDFGGKVISLEEEVKRKNQGVVPDWWKD
jgi:hypothetical protein